MFLTPETRKEMGEQAVALAKVFPLFFFLSLLLLSVEAVVVAAVPFFLLLLFFWLTPIFSLVATSSTVLILFLGC